jgi:hypothetical protein
MAIISTRTTPELRMRVVEGLEIGPRLLPERGSGQQEHRGYVRRLRLLLQLEEQIDQRGDRAEIDPALLQRHRERGQFLPGQAGESHLGGVGVDLDEEPQVVEERRHRRREGDGTVGDFQEAGHDEGDGAHDRRHDGAAEEAQASTAAAYSAE